MDELDEEIKKLQDLMHNSRKQVQEATDLANSNREAEKEISKQERELAQKMAKVREYKNQLQREYNERMARVKTLRLSEEENNRKLQKLLAEREDRKKLSELGDVFDNRTTGAKWREWAYSHQINGAKHLAAVGRAVLGDKRGLGKTLTSLIYLDMIEAKKTIIFTPKDVSINFESEVKTWAPDRPVIVMTSMPKMLRDTILLGLKAAPECTVILNYEAWRKDASLVERLIECQFDTIIVDEAHNIKNHKGIDFKGIQSIVYAENKCPTCGGTDFDTDPKFGKFCASCLFQSKEFGDFCSVKNVVPMTGTPILNRPQEFWPLAHLVDRINFPDLYTFLRQYCIQYGDGKWYFKYGGSDRLLKAVGSKYIGRTPESAGVKMPPQTPQYHTIEFDPKSYPRQWKMMQQIREEGAAMLGEDVVLLIPAVIAMYTRLSQALTFPGGIKIYAKGPDGKSDYKNVLYTCDVTESIKIDKAMEIILQGVEEGDRMILFSRFKEALKEMERRLDAEGISVVRYDGDISSKRAIEAQLDFDLKTAPNHSSNEGCNEKCPNWNKPCSGYKYQVFLGQYQKAGSGLNLNAARQMVILDRYYAPGYEDQASGRIQRLNSTQETVVHIITITSPVKGKSTIDEWMNELMEMKLEMSEGLDNSFNATEFAKALQAGDIY